MSYVDHDPFPQYCYLSCGLASASIDPAASLAVPARRRATLLNLFSGSSGLAPVGIPNGMVIVVPSGSLTVWTLSDVLDAVEWCRMLRSCIGRRIWDPFLTGPAYKVLNSLQYTSQDRVINLKILGDA